MMQEKNKLFLLWENNSYSEEVIFSTYGCVIKNADPQDLALPTNEMALALEHPGPHLTSDWH